MPRSDKRRSLADRLREENAKLKAENEQLRDAARQLLAGLSEYAKTENWSKCEGGDGPIVEGWIWQGDGNGSAVARKFLGLDQQEDGKEE